MDLFNSIKTYISRTPSPARFHMPGHKGRLCSYDITELDFSDDLHSPQGGIRQIQEKCAAVYSAQSAFLLINGSSVGICAFLLALSLNLKRKPKVLVSRDCHKSLISAAFLSDALICGMYPVDEIAGTISAESVRDAINKVDEKPDAIYITSPNYYGMCADTHAIYEIAKQNDILLFVDAAHGAHFPFSDDLPPVPTADVFTVSTHKTLEAFNQTGILLCNCNMEKDLQAALSMLQTTSPSYPLMLSIDNAMNTGKNYVSHIGRIRELRNNLEKNGISLIAKPYSAMYQDLTRICIKSDNLSETGYGLERKLKTYGIYPEMSDLYCAVLITTPCDENEWYERLETALLQIKKENTSHPMKYLPMPQTSEYRYVSVKDALLNDNSFQVGKPAGRAVGIYPPGIAVAFPGETVTKQMTETLLCAEKAGGKVFGR